MFKEIWNELKANLMTVVREAWKKVWESLKTGLQATSKEFLEFLWEFTKDDVILSAQKSLGIIKSYLNSTDAKDKKEYIVELIMTKIKLPLPLKPFKGLVRKLVRDKLDEIINKLIKKSETRLNSLSFNG